MPDLLVVGLGASRGVAADQVMALLSGLDREHGLDPRAVRAFATIDLKANEAGILDAIDTWCRRTGFGEAPPVLLTYPASVLAAVAVPNPSTAVLRATGTPSVAEAAALHAAGVLAADTVTEGDVELVVPKIKSGTVTLAVAGIPPAPRNRVPRRRPTVRS
ncbi:MAG: cobalamin biosynthesis protein [Kutzneria sp.]|nr:cobalamin biosynthesis protein [Kutzneria sp.]MBV9845399.1 cobalamin biosynthesis protein [Kutzneria sp.]